ncbi:histidine kinase [Sulfitobacter sp. SK012]|uniref:DUF6446 family protein n=1 Tax=Sulfitobacter sp. SK012 TaxID=1389005 RepID=UPI000E0BB76E|nr:DUF6446 family protein [Sulfitobacter sp. SK012]AXI47372.1 histidine kinase [Sulfitobacter sp. SK012]
MNGKIVGSVIMVSAFIAGAALYYAQVYGFYQEVSAPADGVELVSVVTNQPEAIPFDAFQAIDADSSPIRYRACFTTLHSLALLSESYALVDGAEPRNGPGWFDCFDAAAIGAELEAGTALAFLAQKNVHFGVDRIVAITSDGRGYAWHELNDCGAKAYDGTITGEVCPDLPTN